MLSTLGFLTRTILFIVVIGLIWSVGGDVAINAYGYDIRIKSGAFIICALIIFYIVALLVRALRKLAAAPTAIKHYNEKRHFDTGMKSLTYGLSAVAAGDARAATHYTNKANRLLSDDYGLVALLSGLTARLKGDEFAAEKSFKSLLNRDETAFLGIRGLMQTAIERNDIRYARVLARQAYAMNPKQEWVIRTLYDLELRMKDFKSVHPVLRQAIATKTMTKEQAFKDEAAMALYQGHADKAHKLSPQWLPAILAVLPNLPPRKARKIIESTWKKTPHPDLLDHWVKLAPQKTGDNAIRIVAWMEKLYALNPDDASGNLYIAEAAITYNQDKQARRFLNKALDIKPTIRVYQLLARLAESDSHDFRQAQTWMELAPTAAHDKTWVCTKSGRLYHEWRAYADDDRYFNTVKWDYPDAIRINNIAEHAHNTPFFLTGTTAAA